MSIEAFSALMSIVPYLNKDSIPPEDWENLEYILGMGRVIAESFDPKNPEDIDIDRLIAAAKEVFILRSTLAATTKEENPNITDYRNREERTRQYFTEILATIHDISGQALD